MAIEGWNDGFLFTERKSRLVFQWRDTPLATNLLYKQYFMKVITFHKQEVCLLRKQIFVQKWCGLHAIRH